jgi:type II secretory pathway pseudopilin PulG
MKRSVMAVRSGHFHGRRKAAAGFTLAEVVVSIAIAALLFVGIIGAYIQSGRRAEWSGYSLAAQALAIQQLEQARSAVWDPALTPVKNEITNLNLISWTYANGVGSGYTTNTLDLPISGTNYVWATNFVSFRLLTNMTGVPGVQVQMIRVDTVWPFFEGNATRAYTNTVASYYAPDNP